MLNGDGIENGKKTTSTTTTTTTIGLISKKITLHVQHTFLYISLPLLLHDYNVKLSTYTFHGGNVVCSRKKLLLVFLYGFFFTPTHFHLTGRCCVSKFVSFVFSLSPYLFLCYPRQPRH